MNRDFQPAISFDNRDYGCNTRPGFSGPLGVSDIGAFVRRHAPRHGRGWTAQMVTGLRSS
jgi:hypothetical protein